MRLGQGLTSVWLASRAGGLRALALVATLLMLAACSVQPPVTPERALRERAEAYWAARVVGDHVTAYDLEAVSVSPEGNLQRYLAGRGALVYDKASVEEVRIVSADKAQVRVAFTYRLPLPGLRKAIEADAWSDWVMIDGKWYHAPRPGVMWRPR